MHKFILILLSFAALCFAIPSFAQDTNRVETSQASSGVTSTNAVHRLSDAELQAAARQVTKIVRHPYQIVMSTVVRCPYPVVQARIREKGGKEIVKDGQRWSVLVIEEGSSTKSIIDCTWVRATSSGTNETRIEVESVKDPAFTYWQTSRAKRRLMEFLRDLQ